MDLEVTSLFALQVGVKWIVQTHYELHSADLIKFMQIKANVDI